MVPFWRRSILHPFLFAAYPVLALFAFNMGQSRLSDALRALIILPILTGFILFLLGKALRDWGRAGMMTSLLFLLFFSYGHVIDRLSTTRFGPLLVQLPWLVAVIYLIVLGAGTYLILFKVSRSGGFTYILNTVGFILLLLPIITITTFNLANRAPTQTQFLPATTENPQAIVPRTNPPDIYYIIPDGYARADVLDKLYGVNNLDFIGYLKSKGFYVADDSHSNYDQTALSVASSLNFDYLDAYTAELGIDSQNRDPLYDAIDHSRLRQALEEAGYVFVDVNSGNPITQIKDAPYYLTPSRSMLINFFEREILAGSAIGGLIENDLTEQYRARMINEFELGSDLGWIPSPKFVFIHFLAPHPPFVFDAVGDPITPPELVLRDGSRYPGGRENYLSGYSQQIRYINIRLEKMLDAILANSGASMPVIILQGDHGPGAYLDWSSADNSCIVERTGILNAYLLPGVDQQVLYPGITPVNTFRVVMNAYLGTHYPLLPDRTYMPTWDRPYDFIEVTGQDESCTIVKE